MRGRLFHVDGFLQPVLSYAQNYEDITLRRALQDVEGGFWVDIGANHPVDHSVTKLFSDLGWSGVNVEPNPYFLGLLNDQRPNDINLGVGVGERSGVFPLHVIGDSGLTTLRADFAETHELAGHAVTETIEVDVVPLDDLLDEHCSGRTIDFLKIDAEGSEVDIVRGASFTTHRPRIVLIENLDGYHSIILGKGYLFAWYDGLNRYYVREEDEWRIDLLARPPSIWDSFRPYSSEAQLQAIQRQIDNLPRQFQEDWKRKSQEHEETICRLESERDALLRSTSWRLTRPLRLIASKFIR